MEKHAKSFLFQSLSMTLFQRGNACVIGAAAHHRALEEIYNLGNWNTRNFQKAAFLMRSQPVQSCGADVPRTNRVKRPYSQEKVQQ